MKQQLREPCSREYALTQVEEGWHSLVHQIYDKKESLTTPIYIDEVKEKFGGLRVYSTPYHDEFDNFTIEICKHSFNICEICGESGYLVKTSSGWYKTRCDLHCEDSYRITDVAF
jgi:hypothetical protein